MENSTEKQPSKSAGIRGEFDRILMRHVSGLIDTREDIAALPFNLATIACLLLLMERENEIKSFPDSPPERYNRNTFFTDIEEIGIDLDEEVMVAIQNLDQYGFVVVGANDQYTVRESAALLIMILDAIFPQMPGMNLVAYVSQAIEEVASGRKDAAHALQQFDQTLDKQGVRLSTLPEEQLPDVSEQRGFEKPDPAILKERRTAYLRKLKQLRDRDRDSTGAPAIVGSVSRLKNIVVKDLFPKNSPAPDPGEVPETKLPSDAAVAPEAPPIADSPPAPMDPLPAADAPLGTTEPPPVTAPETPPESVPAVTPTPPAVSGSDISPPEPPPVEAESVPAPPPSQPRQAETSPEPENMSEEDLVAQKIQAFEEALAMPCPICGSGKVLSSTTEKGKTYYYCSNEECKLISWGRPHPMPCPLCKNPFLIEVTGPDSEVGLKCPRATCLYRKKSLTEAMSSGSEGPGKRKVAVVKRRKKGVRRVVRRKSS